eukprot:3292566-Alexandrium_andersonii.AAC.1
MSLALARAHWHSAITASRDDGPRTSGRPSAMSTWRRIGLVRPPTSFLQVRGLQAVRAASAFHDCQ